MSNMFDIVMYADGTTLYCNLNRTIYVHKMYLEPEKK